MWGTSGTGRLRVKSDNGMKVIAKAMRVQESWFDPTLKQMSTTSTSWSSWSTSFDLTKVDVGYYVKLEGSVKEVMGRGEFEVSQ